MGYWYWRSLKKDWAVDEATSNKFDLPEKGHLSALLIELLATNAAYLQTTRWPWPMQHVVLRVVGNGNVEIVDLEGRHLQAMNFWDTGEMPKDNLHIHASGIPQQYAFIPFGRYLGDPKYGLILEKFAAGVEFEETNDFSTSYYTDGTEKYTIHGLFRKDPEPGLFGGGYLKKRCIKIRDTAAESEVDCKLPTINKLRQIHMFVEADLDTSSPYRTTVGPFKNMEDLYLSVKSKEEYILRDMSTRRFTTYMHQWLGRRAHTQMVAYGGSLADGDTYDTMIYERESSFALSLHTGVRCFMNERPDKGWLERVAQVEAYGADNAVHDCRFYLDSWGMMYQGDVPLLMQRPESGEEEWLDAEANKDVYVSWDEDSSEGNEGLIFVVLDELEKAYPT